jgi:hypothetical protein
VLFLVGAAGRAHKNATDLQKFVAFVTEDDVKLQKHTKSLQHVTCCATWFCMTESALKSFCFSNWTKF